MENAVTGVEPISILNALYWRYATKVFDPNKKIPGDQFELLLECLRLSPSSIDIQPWKFIVVNDINTRRELVKLSMLQTQLSEASHLVILCSLTDMDSRYIDKLITLEKKESGGYSTFEQFRSQAISYIGSKSKGKLKEWMAEQVYIALGFLLSACAMLKIDACPIEAFDHDKVNALLGLKKYGVESRVAVALGYRSEKDTHSRDKKLRWPKEEVIVSI